MALDVYTIDPRLCVSPSAAQNGLPRGGGWPCPPVGKSTCLACLALSAIISIFPVKISRSLLLGPRVLSRWRLALHPTDHQARGLLRASPGAQVLQPFAQIFADALAKVLSIFDQMEHASEDFHEMKTMLLSTRCALQRGCPARHEFDSLACELGKFFETRVCLVPVSDNVRHRSKQLTSKQIAFVIEK